MACRWVRHNRYPHLALTGRTPITVFSSSALTHLAHTGIHGIAEQIDQPAKNVDGPAEHDGWARFVPPALIDRNGARAEVRKPAGRISAGLPYAGYLWAAQKLEFLCSTAYTIAQAVFSLTFS